MSRALQPYQRQVGLTVPAVPVAPGAAFGQAAVALAGQFNEADEQRQVVDVSKRIAAAKLEWSQRLVDAPGEVEPGAPGYAAKYLDEMRADLKERGKGFSGKARGYWEARSEDMIGTLGLHAGEFEAKQRAAKVTADVIEAADMQAKAVRSDPRLLDGAIKEVRGMIAGMTGVDPEKRRVAEKDALNRLGVSALEATFDRSPGQAYKDLQSGKYDSIIDADRKVALMNKAEREIKRLQSEGAAEARAQRMVSAVTLEADARDAAMSIARTGTAGKGLEPETLMARAKALGMPPASVQRMGETLALARDGYEIGKLVSTAPADELPKIMQEWAFQPGMGAAASAQREQIAATAIENRQKALQADAPAYILGNVPGVRDALATAQTANTPEAWGRYVTVMRDAQAHFGVIPKVRNGDPANVPVLPASVAGKLAADIAGADGQARAAKIDGLRAQLGDQAFNALWPQLVKAGLPASASTIAQIDPANAGAKQAAAVAMTEGPEAIKAMAPDVRKAVDTEIDAALKPFASTLPTTVAASKEFDRQREAIRNQAAIYARTMSPADAARKAADDILNHKYQYLSGGMYGEGIRVPSKVVDPQGRTLAYDARRFEDFLIQRSGSLKPSDISLPAGFAEDIRVLGEPAVKERLLSAGDLVWRNNADDTGVFLFRAKTGMPLFGADGRPIEVKWGDAITGALKPVPTAPGIPRAAPAPQTPILTQPPRPVPPPVKPGGAGMPTVR